MTEAGRGASPPPRTAAASTRRPPPRAAVSRSPFLTPNGLQCADVETAVCVKDRTLTNECVDKIVDYALSEVMNSSVPTPGKDVLLALFGESLQHGVDLSESMQNDQKEKSTKKSLKDVAMENEFEKRLLSDVIPPDEMGVSFDDIGALENFKETLLMKEISLAEAENKPLPPKYSSIDVCPLNMSDLKQAHEQWPQWVGDDTCSWCTMAMGCSSCAPQHSPSMHSRSGSKDDEAVVQLPERVGR